jgi:thiamine biosynthesis lipoprotein
MSITANVVRFPALGTTATLVVADDRAMTVARELLDAELEAMDRTASRFRTDSEVVRLEATGRPEPISALLANALAVALRAAALTDGLVDPTVGRAMSSIGYDRDFALVDPDGPELVVTFRPIPQWRAIKLDEAACTVSVPPGVSLDLGATAKALCADRAAERIASESGSGVAVSLGGDVAIAGPSPEQGWPVEVCDDHAHPEQGPSQTVMIRSGGLATSSTTVRRWTRGHRRLHHVVDPSTGQPATGCWRTATVAAATCVDANIASTASIILGDAAPAWLTARAMPARLVASDGSVTTVGGWPSDAALRAAAVGRADGA